jgi:hypothetical protein
MIRFSLAWANDGAYSPSVVTVLPRNCVEAGAIKLGAEGGFDEWFISFGRSKSLERILALVEEEVAVLVDYYQNSS